MDVESQVGISHGDIRTFARLLPKLIDNGILYFIGYKFRVAEFFAEYHRIDSKGLVESQIFRPIDILYLLIHVICRPGDEMFDGFENTDSGVQLEICAIH